MLKPIAIAAVSATCLALAVPAGAAGLPETLARALEGAEQDTVDGWAFRKTTLVDAMDEPAVKTVTLWDPSKPKGEQCTVVSVDVLGKAKEGVVGDKDPCKDSHDRESYADLREMLDDAIVTQESEDGDVVTYHVEPRDKKRGFHMGGLDVDVDSADEDMVGTVEVVKAGPGAPYVRRLSLHLRESAGNLVAKVRKLDVMYTYGVDEATGVKLMNGMAVDIDLSLFALLNVTTKVITRYDQFRRLP